MVSGRDRHLEMQPKHKLRAINHTANCPAWQHTGVVSRACAQCTSAHDTPPPNPQLCLAGWFDGSSPLTYHLSFSLTTRRHAPGWHKSITGIAGRPDDATAKSLHLHRALLEPLPLLGPRALDQSQAIVPCFPRQRWQLPLAPSPRHIELSCEPSWRRVPGNAYKTIIHPTVRGVGA